MAKRKPVVMVPADEYDSMVEVVRAIARSTTINVGQSWVIQLANPEFTAAIWHIAFNVTSVIGRDDG